MRDSVKAFHNSERHWFAGSWSASRIARSCRDVGAGTGTFVGAKDGTDVDGTNVGTCVGFGVGLRVGSGFGVGAGVGYFVGFAVLGAGVGCREGRGVGFFVNKYGFVRINCSMRSLPRRCCMRQRALRAASSAPHATSTTASARRMAAHLY